MKARASGEIFACFVDRFVSCVLVEFLLLDSVILALMTWFLFSVLLMRFSVFFVVVYLLLGLSFDRI